MATETWPGRVFGWFDVHGRHDLPWQHPREPYRVWVSEIMLQQTTVAAVIPFYERFLAELPTVEALAETSQDQLMALWSGLGYYARARNLHKSAQIIMRDHGGRFPEDLETLQSLPGIGRSTAAAILAQAFGRPAAILDGNVKRLLARHAGIEGWPGRSAVLAALWAEAEARLPDERSADYAQALMDLGARVCKSRQPDCANCPVAEDCVARRDGLIGTIPGRKPAKSRPQRRHWYLLLRNADQQILLERRAPSGIWGGLWSLPEAKEDPAEFAGLASGLEPVESVIQHEFSHFSLELVPVLGDLCDGRIADEGSMRWHTVESALALGLPQPIRKLIEIHCQ